MKDGKLTVYNKEYPEGFSPDDTGSWAGAIKTTPIDTDTIVPENSVFVCGDNRSNSLDSRSFGSIDSDSIVGVATVRFLPLRAMDNTSQITIFSRYFKFFSGREMISRRPLPLACTLCVIFVYRAFAEGH